MTSQYSPFRLWIPAALAGLALYYFSVNRVVPINNHELTVDRSKAIEIASAFLTEKGYPIADYSSTALFDHDDNFGYLTSVTGYEQAVEISRNDQLGIYSPFWLVFFHQNLPQSTPQRKFRVNISTTGKVTGFTHDVYQKVPNDEFGPVHLPVQEASSLAIQSAIRFGIDTTGFTQTDARSDKTELRTNHTFWFEKPDSILKTDIRLGVTISGSEVTSIDLMLQIPESFTTSLLSDSTTLIFGSVGSTVIFIVILGLLMATFLKKYHEGEIGIEGAGTVFWIAWGLMAIESALVFPFSAFGWGLGEVSFDGIAWVQFIFKLLVINPIMALAAFMAWSVGESYLREQKGNKLKAMDALINRKLTTLELADSTSKGYLAGLTGLGIIGLMQFTGVQSGFAEPTMNQAALLHSAWIPMAFPFVAAATGSLLSELLFRLFTNTYLARRFKKPLVGILAGSLLWTVYAAVFWNPLYTNASWWSFLTIFLLGLYFSFLMAKYDILTTIMANFTIYGAAMLIPLLTGDSFSFLMTAGIAFLLLLIPGMIAVLGFIKRDSFEYKPDSTPAHIKRIAERVRLSRELEIARQVQLKLLPKKSPEIPGFQIAGNCHPALEVGGDYFDFITIDKSKIGIAVGDVSGKGLPAAIYMTLTKGIVQSNAEIATTPSKVLSKANQLLCRMIEKGNFVSMFYAVLDFSNRTMTIARAGHNPAVWVVGGDKTENLKPEGFALGLEAGDLFEKVIRDQTVTLNRGDAIIFYTDGYTEAMNTARDEYGEERLLATISANQHLSADELIAAINEDVKKFCGNAPQHDDMTIVVVKVL